MQSIVLSPHVSGSSAVAALPAYMLKSSLAIQLADERLVILPVSSELGRASEHGKDHAMSTAEQFNAKAFTNPNACMLNAHQQPLNLPSEGDIEILTAGLPLASNRRHGGLVVASQDGAVERHKSSCC